MYKMVTGSVGELEGKLNEASAAGFTEVVREFSDRHVPIDINARELAPVTYSYLLKKPDRSPLSLMFEGISGELLQMLVTGVMSGSVSGIKVDVEEEPETPATSTSSATAAA